MLRGSTVLLLGAALVTTASAQTTIAPPPGGNRLTITSEPREGPKDAPVRVQVSVTYFVSEAVDDSSPQADKIREDGRMAVYRLAAGECANLQSVLATECKLENVNVTVSRQSGARAEGFAVRANMTYRIAPK